MLCNRRVGKVLISPMTTGVQVVRERLQSLDWRQVTDDVRPFLEPSADPDLLTRENLMRVLG